MRVGIVGCGGNSAYHVKFARSYQGAEIVGVVDSDQRKATLCAERFGITGVFSTVSELVKERKPDIVHIVTPPQTHLSLAKEVIESKCHVLVEKPLALNLEEGRALYEFAERHGVRLCPMHNHYFDPCVSKAYDLVQKGHIGRVISVESYYGLNPEIPLLREYPAPNVLPWIYDLPYGLYQDFLPHPLYVLLDLIGKPREVHVVKQVHGVLPRVMPDEVRVLLEGEKAVGTFSLSFVAKPHLHFLRIYGTEMMVEVDFNTMTTVTHPVSSGPKAIARAAYNLSTSTQLLINTVVNALQFLAGSLKSYQGMKVLIHRFYDSIQRGGDSPITKGQSLLVLETIDRIGKQLVCGPVSTSRIPASPSYSPKHREKILVTGGTGFLGRKLVEQLVSERYPVRVLARKLSNIEPITRLGAEIVFGDVRDKSSLEEVFKGVTVVVHAAAGTTGNTSACEAATVEGTRNILELCGKNSIRKLVYISSCSVYGVTDYKPGQVITEEALLERFPTRRGAYSAAKLRAENLVIEAMKVGKIPVVILRPGTIYGPGGNVFSPMVGLSVKNKVFVVIGNGRLELPLVYVDEVAEAILKCIEMGEADGEIFNLVGSESITKRMYVEKLLKRVYPRARFFYLPYVVVSVLVLAQELACRILRRKALLTGYRLVSSQRTIRYDGSKIARRLNWRSSRPFEKAVEVMINDRNGAH